MSKKPADKHIFSDFFREEAAGLLGLDDQQQDNAQSTDHTKQPLPRLPALLAAAPAGDTDLKVYWRRLRAFFRSGQDDKGEPAAAAAVFPALLAPFRDHAGRANDYPFWVAESGDDTDPPFCSLSTLLQNTLRKTASGDGQARILKDNLPRLERIAREKVQRVDAAFKAYPVLIEALDELEQQLAIPGEEGEQLAADCSALKKALPRRGLLIALHADAPFHLLAALLNRQQHELRQEVKAEIGRLQHRLDALLEVERAKDPEANTPEHLHDSLDFADTYLNFDELSALLPGENSEKMPAERRRRIEEVLATLQGADEILDGRKAVLLLDRHLKAGRTLHWQDSFPGVEIMPTPAETLCERALAEFDERLQILARLFAALRIARLELANRYAGEMHDHFFAHFDWQSFSAAELAACPPVLLLTTADALWTQQLNEFSQLLASNRPIKAVLVKATLCEPEEATQPFHREIGPLTIGHRNPFVWQGSAVRPGELLTGLQRGLTAFAPAVFHLLAPDWPAQESAAAFLHLSAAIEGRAFPGFAYDSERGPQWGSRFDISNNPQPDGDWPGHPLAFTGRDGATTTQSVHFTFADFAALEAPYAAYFQVVPPEYWTDDLLPVTEFLALPPEEAHPKVPYIWMVDADHTLQRAAVAWPVIARAKERLDLWHYLQENAGIHSYHVEQATARVRRELEAHWEQRLSDLEADHRRETELVRENTTRHAMEQLAAALLDLEMEGELLATPGPTVKQVGQKEKTLVLPTKPETAEPGDSTEIETISDHPLKAEDLSDDDQEEEEEALDPGEAWIETPLCTSCNECINLNKRIFKYNADKQAYIADASAGPFSDIVKAAEKCPARIIHPGAPVNPNEPGLEKWVKRAEKYN